MADATPAVTIARNTAPATEPHRQKGVSLHLFRMMVDAKDLRGTEPDGMYDMMVRVVEKPLLEVVMQQADNNQSRAAQWLGLNRNTLRKKLVEHKLIN